MDCVLGRELVSADLDGEATTGERDALARHLERCTGCRRFADDAGRAQRRWRVGPAPVVPDLTGAILAAPPAAAASDGLPWWRPSRWADLGAANRTRAGGVRRLVLQIGLGALGVLELVLAAPSLIAHQDGQAEQHAAHHLNAWAVAFAVGLLVAAFQPWRVRGLLPLASALGVVMAGTVILDLVNRHAVAMPATSHVIELGGLALMWALSRSETAPRSGPAGRLGRFRGRRAGDTGVGSWLTAPPGPRGVASGQALDEVA